LSRINSFFVYGYHDPLYIHSFPTRRSSDLYLSAPVNNQLYNGITIAISEEKAELTLKVEEKFFHAANAIHGSVYFKMLDDERIRSEEHTSELQSQSNLVCRLLLEKKKKKII